MGRTSKLKTAIKVIRTVKNWPTYFADYFQLIKKRYVVYTLRNGIKLRVNSKTAWKGDRGLMNEIWIQRPYTPDGFEINGNDIVLDIGAHIGMFSVFASGLSRNGIVYAFEPVSENFDMLKYNIELNDIKNIIPINKAISDKTGKKEIFLSDTTSFVHSFCYRSGRKGINVDTISLMDFIEENSLNQIDFIKMDCEGAEYEILFSCPDALLKMIEKISMEYHYIDETHNVTSLKKFLTEKGFDVKMKQLGTGNGNGMMYAKR